MVKRKVKELMICYVNGTTDQFLNVEFTLNDDKEIALKDIRDRYVYIQLNSVLKYIVRK